MEKKLCVGASKNYMVGEL